MPPPPIPIFEASHAPLVPGFVDGTTSSMLMGRMPSSSANHQKSCKNACTWQPSLTCVPSLALWRRASRKEQNRSRAHGMANVMDRSLPITFCHFLVEVRLWAGVMLARMEFRRFTRCAGNGVVLVVVSSTHPRTTLRVAQVASPFNSFLMETGSWRNGPSVLMRP
jgi:hypothetical protein